MPAPRVNMRKLKDALRLKLDTEYAQWLHKRRGLAAETISDCAAEAGRLLSWYGKREAACAHSGVAIAVGALARSWCRPQVPTKVKCIRASRNDQ